MNPMQRVLIVEDNAEQIYLATSILMKLGVQHVNAITSVAFALEYLQDITEGKRTRPDVVVLDLEFGRESGFEILRFWKSAPALKNVRVVVWTVMGELEQKMAAMFGVEQVVDKADGAKALEQVLRSLVAGGNSSSTVSTH
jgi:CheY-like chemotaxis protein